MSGYAKLFSEIVDSSIWDEDSDTCKVWITLLALADQDGYVRGSDGWLAGKSRVSLGKCVLALGKFKEPDLRSRTPDNGGRRIEQLDDGWLILNYISFRDRLSNDPKASATRERVRKHREDYHSRRPPGNRKPPASLYDGYVYYILEPAANRVKIGYSSNPWARLSELRNGNPTLQIEATERGSIDTEKQRHEQFASFRLECEWFTYSKEIKEFVVALRSNYEPSVGVTSDVSASASASSVQDGGLGEGMLLTEDEAVAQCNGVIGIPEKFVRYVYGDWASRNGCDAKGVPVRWAGYIKKRWNREQDEFRAEIHQCQKKSVPKNTNPTNYFK